MEIDRYKGVYEALIENTSDMIFSMSLPKGRYLYVSPSSVNIVGFTPEALYEKPMLIKTVIHPDSISFFQKSWKELIETGKIDPVITYKAFNKQRQTLWLRQENVVVLNNKGKPKILIGRVTDITETEKTELALKEIQELFELFMKHLPGLAYIKDSDRRSLFANHGLKTYLGIDPDEIKGKTNLEAFFGDFAAKMDADDRAVLESGETRTVEEEAVGRIWSTTKFIIPRKDEKPLLGGFTFDITDRKKYETELKTAREKAEESDRLKTAFLANMSHEIRTPMNGIIGFTEMLNEPEINEEERHYFANIIIESCQKLLSIVNDVLDISKIETGQMKIFEEETDLISFIDNMNLFFQPIAKKKKLTLRSDCFIKNGQNLIMTDKVKLTQIMNNLINNAIKFTHEGDVKFGCSVDENEIKFYVRDTGIGIPKAFREAIFERFRQAEPETGQKYGGTGLGLSISKAYIEMMGGSLSLKSQEGKGSEFTFILPRKEIKQSLPKKLEGRNPVIPSNFQSPHILIVEDEETNRLYLEAVLRRISTSVYFAKTGDEALSIFTKYAETGIPHLDIILLDIKLPDMSGLDIARKIRSRDDNITIIAQTAYALRGDREKALEAGCSDYLSKPIKRNALLNIIYNCIKN